MTDTTAILFRLMSLLSPAYPTGAFSYSHGLEWAVESGLVTDEAGLEQWIGAVLEREFGPVNGYLLRQAWQAVHARSDSALLEALAAARAMVASAELELESTAQGGAFHMTTWRLGCHWLALEWIEAVLARAPGPLPYPFILAAVAAAAGLPLEMTLTAFLHACAGNLVSAALRLMRLGQTAGQAIIARLEGAVIICARAAITRDAADVGTAMPLLDWCSIQHETQYTRLFRS